MHCDSPMLIGHAVTLPSSVSLLLDSAFSGQCPYKDVHEELMKVNWITDELDHEITSNCPRVDDIEKETGKRNQASLDKACLTLFPVGRKFASSYQLIQSVHKLLNQWGTCTSSHGTTIKCHFAKQPNRKKRNKTDKRYKAKAYRVRCTVYGVRNRIFFIFYTPYMFFP